MTQNEKEALLGYMEFHLVTFCEGLEKNLSAEAVGGMYNEAYNILNDMEFSIQSHIDNMGDKVDTRTKK